MSRSVLCIEALLLLHHVSSITFPNFIYILVDDLGWANVQFHNERMMTPTLDSLLTQSLILNHYYTYKFCSPTRSAFLSGRIPYHVNEENGSSCVPGQGIPLNMTTISERLVNDCGYYAHQIGKWHVGMYSNLNTPHGRMFNTSLGYLHGAEDHFTQLRAESDGGQTCTGTDLWMTDKPAYGINGTYGGYIYTKRAVEIINEHHTYYQDIPLFMYIAIQNNHSPYEVPQEYTDKFNASWYPLQRQVAGMSNFLDVNMIYNVTTVLKQTGLWNNTLLIISSDNGGCSGTDGSAANNSPLRGGKYSNFEGGVRVINLISGGYLPEQRRGISINGMMHIADWYSTFLYLAGNTDPFDIRANKTGFPPIDSINMWPFISGESNISARTQFVLSSGTSGGIMYQPNNTVANDSNDSMYKLIFGIQSPAFWTTYDYPNGTSGEPQSVDCGSVANGGCFFDIMNDITEHINLINDTKYKDLIEEMRQKFIDLEKTKIIFNRGSNEKECCEQIEQNHGYWGYWVHCTEYITCTYNTTNGRYY